jgi:hypothetical protein
MIESIKQFTENAIAECKVTYLIFLLKINGLKEVGVKMKADYNPTVV